MSASLIKFLELLAATDRDTAFDSAIHFGNVFRLQRDHEMADRFVDLAIRIAAGQASDLARLRSARLLAN